MARLKRSIGLFELVFYGVGVILGAGIYTLVGQGAGITGGSLWMSFAIGAFVASFTGLSYAELSCIFPKAGAEYEYVKNAFGIKLMAFLVGWLIIVTGITAITTVSLGFAGYFKSLFGTPIIIVAIGLIVITSYINFWGIKESSRFNILFTLIEVSGLLIIILLALFHFDKIRNADYFQMTNGISGVFSAAALVFFAYLGFEHIANVSEEAKSPKRILAKAFILSILITTILYVLTSIAVVSLANPGELGKSQSPLSLAVSKTFLNGNAPAVISSIALFSTANTVLVMILASSRIMYGMSRDGSLPGSLSKIHKSNKTPHFAIMATMVLSIIFLFFGGIALIANFTSLGSFMAFAMVNASLIWMRFKYPKMKRTFRSPVNIGNFPVLAFLGIVSSVFMIFQFEFYLIAYTLVSIASGIVIYEFVQKKILK